MTILLTIIIIVLIAGFIGLFYFLNQRFKAIEQNKKNEDNQGVLMIQEQIGEIRKGIQSQHEQNIKIVERVTEKLGELDKTNQQVVNFAGQLQNLQDILKNPKQRGILGEFYLEAVLKNVFPPGSYQMQYKLGKDEQTDKDLIVDAVVFIKDKIIPIDAKFSLENYNRLINEHDIEKQEKLEKLFKKDLKNRIDETSKYIRPEKNTFDFAFMFIPSEAIYYDLLVGKIGAIKASAINLIEYAFREKQVIVVSPTTFLAYLQMVLQGLRALQIEESTKEIKKNVERLSAHILKYDIFLQKLGQNLGTTVNAYNTAYKEFKKVDKDIMKITDVKGNKVNPLSLEKPKSTN